MPYKDKEKRDEAVRRHREKKKVENKEKHIGMVIEELLVLVKELKRRVGECTRTK